MPCVHHLSRDCSMKKLSKSSNFLMFIKKTEKFYRHKHREGIPQARHTTPKPANNGWEVLMALWFQDKELRFCFWATDRTMQACYMNLGGIARP